MREDTDGLLCGISSADLMPCAFRCLVTLRPQELDEKLRQRLLLKNGLHRLRLRFRGVRHGRALRLRLRHGKAHRSGQLPQLLQLRGIIQYGAQRALQLIH